MNSPRFSMLLAMATCCAGIASAADPAPEAKTFLAARGASLGSDDLAKPLEAPWKIAKGKWEVDGGAVRVSELAADMHGAAARRPLPTRNFVLQVSFRFDGGKAASVSINDAKGHCCRASLTPKSLVINKDSHDHNKDDKAVKLDSQPLSLEPGSWHTLVVEVVGPELVASVDGEHVAFGRHDSIDIDKKDFGLTVSGESVSFKDLRVWEATARPDWESTKAALPPRVAAAPAAKKAEASSAPAK